MSKRYNPNKVKINRNYTVREIALLYGVHKKTVTNWFKRGLTTISKQGNYLILGSDLKDFIKYMRSVDKRPCEINEMFCMKCRVPREPERETLFFAPLSQSSGCMKGSCVVCNTPMNKFFNLTHLPVLQRNFDVTLPLQQKRLI